MLEQNTSNALCDKWAPILEGINDAHTRECTVVLLENQARHVLAEQSKGGLLEESTTVGQLGTFQKFAFPLVRRVFPELIANKVVGVQPMQGPVSQVFYLGFDRIHGEAGVQGVYGKYLQTYRGLVAGPLDSSGMEVSLDASTIGWDFSSTNKGAAATEPAGHAFSATLGGGTLTAGADGNLVDASSIGTQIASFPSSTLTQYNTSAGEAASKGGIPEINFHIEQQAVIAS